MVEIKNAKVYDLEESVIASGNAMRLEPEVITSENFDKSLERCKKLSKLGGGSGHSNFRTGITISFDLKYPQYFTKQVQRYHFLQYVSSTSMMHCITKMDFSKCCNRYVMPSTIMQIKYLIYLHDSLLKDKEAFSEAKKCYIEFMKEMSRDYKEKLLNETLARIEAIDNSDDLLYDIYMSIISNCPMGAELWVHCSTNYEQLATIYRQRKNHKLKEDWGEFCKWIENLPYAKELIICE